ncbi:FmdB family zinc ribbon protein [Leptothrix discophora]|uniref:Zinc ribbon domain-containing protein n=1 Tax=Leptothrix discophora TaxID=89 RepID=A0ABT9G5S4_LEPDI|nr:FmdB family zinc ribbon protein [Leptothrix discophora]MDP4301836.1 zinc ribbon domain-containing protein [Leptothrix discophora]
MPIYAYRCSACGHAKDVLQKMSDPALTTCPSCGAEAYAKQVTAAGFQLKGSGWYATDFRNGGSSSGTASAPATGATPAPADGGNTGGNTGGSTSGDSGPTASASGGASGGASCGGSCACH